MKKIKFLAALLAVLICIAFCSCATTEDIAKISITLSDKLINYEVSAKDILNEYIALRLKVMYLGDSSAFSSKEELKETVDGLYSRFSELNSAIEALTPLTDSVSKLPTKTEFVQNVKKEPLFGTAVSAAESSKRAIDWANEITAAYESYPVGKQLKGLALYLGTDCKTALAKLEAAQGIISNEYENEAQMWDDLADAATVIQTTCKVELCVAGIASAEYTTLLDAGIAAFNGSDTLVAVGTSGCEILLGENHCLTLSMQKLKNILAPISSVTGLLTFNSPDTSVADRIAYIGDSLTDLTFEGKIFGISFNTEDIHHVIVSGVYTKTEQLETDGYTISENSETSPITPENIGQINGDILAEREDISKDMKSTAETLNNLFAVEEEEETVDPFEEKDKEYKEMEEKEEQERKQREKEARERADIEGKYNIGTVNFVQSGTKEKGQGAMLITVDGTTLTLLNEADKNSEKMIFTYDPKTDTAVNNDSMNGQSTITLKFDKKGNMTYTMVNNNDGKVYLIIDAVRIVQ